LKLENAFLSLIILLLHGGCSSPETVSSQEAKELNISSYFPEVGLKRSYVQYGTTGENLYPTDEVKNEYDSKGNELIYIHEKNGLAVETIEQYEIYDNEVVVVHRINPLMNKEVNEIELANKTKWETGDPDNTSNYLTGSGLSIEVTAGTFEDVIEVTNVVSIESEDSREIIKYYAPNVGLIKMVFLINNEEHVFMELETTNLKSLSNSNQKKVEDVNENTNEPEVKETKSETGNTYKNEDFGFSFTFPGNMLDKVRISYGAWSVDSEESIDFTYLSEQVEQYLFSIVVYNGAIEEQNWENPMQMYIGNNGTKTFSLATAGDPSESLLSPENEEHLKNAQDILQNVDVIINSFQFHVR